jgi:hypothetical protein
VLIWQYWEGHKSDFIELCMKSVVKNNKEFEVRIVNPKNIHNYLPDIRDDLSLLPRIANKVDYIRFKLLDKYGGVWIDADVVCFEGLDLLYKKLLQSDYTFGSTGYGGVLSPSVWMMMAKPSSKVTSEYIIKADNILDNMSKSDIGWNDLGSLCLKDIDDKILSSQAMFFPTELFCPVKYNEWRKYFINNLSDIEDMKNGVMFVFFNEMLRQSGMEFMRLKRHELLNAKNLMSEVFKHAGIEL